MGRVESSRSERERERERDVGTLGPLGEEIWWWRPARGESGRAGEAAGAGKDSSVCPEASALNSVGQVPLSAATTGTSLPTTELTDQEPSFVPIVNCNDIIRLIIL